MTAYSVRKMVAPPLAAVLLVLLLLCSSTTTVCHAFLVPHRGNTAAPAAGALQNNIVTTTTTRRFMARYQFEFNEDFYVVLNVTRDANPQEIRRQYRNLARDWHPDVFVDELKFDPNKMTVPQLKQFLNEQRVGISTLVEKSELETKAWETYRRTQTVPSELQEKRTQIQDRFALLNEAYNTLYDDDKRRMYDLSGDWGIPGIDGRTRKNGKYDMGDREEAARVRKRREAAQRTKLQERVYQEYLQKQQEEQVKEKKRKEEVKQKLQQKEEERKQKEAQKPKLTPEQEKEQRAANQEKIKAMWGNAFNNIFKQQ